MPPKRRAATKRKAAATTAAAKPQTRATRGRAPKRTKIEEEEEEVEAEEEAEEVEENEEENTTSTAKKTEPEPAAEEGNSSKSEIAKKLRAADAEKAVSKKHKPDSGITNSLNYQVVDDYDVMLNQTNIGGNNNKFYVIQTLLCGGMFYTFTRWGRVGETGRNQMFGPYSVKDHAVDQFMSKFKDKTGNHWDNRNAFKKIKGKYDMIEVTGEEEEISEPSESAATSKGPTTYLPSKLDNSTQNLMRFLFDKDMFQSALKKFDIDVKKMPLGKLSKTQVAKGFETLEEIEGIIEGTGTGSLMELSSKFYTIIPHNFGRTRPPVINTIEGVQQKYDMLAVLADIELAQSMQKDKDGSAEKEVQSAKPHPHDENYNLLQCDLTLVDVKSEEYEIIKRYTENTQGYRKCKILDVWRVNRHGEGQHFAAHAKLDNRKLLWHGTNAAVVVAILKSGLRIMPHSGGRVGKGIYFASENGKSSGYVGTASDGSHHNIGIMFLNEVALGKEHTITADDSSLKSPPTNFDSIVARGQTEPDPKGDTKLEIDGNDVIVPTGKPIPTTYKTSSFSQSEYLIYRENQCRIRYLLKMQF